MLADVPLLCFPFPAPPPTLLQITAKEKSTLLVLRKVDFQTFLSVVPDMKRDVEFMARQRTAQVCTVPYRTSHRPHSPIE